MAHVSSMLRAPPPRVRRSFRMAHVSSMLRAPPPRVRRSFRMTRVSSMLRAPPPRVRRSLRMTRGSSVPTPPAPHGPRTHLSPAPLAGHATAREGPVAGPPRPAPTPLPAAHSDRDQRGARSLIADELRPEGAAHRVELRLHLGDEPLRALLEHLQAPGHALELILELEHALHAREVHPELAGQLLDAAQAVDVALGVQPRALGRALRVDEPARLVHPQGLGVHLGELRRHGDHEDALVLGHPPHDAAAPLASRSRPARGSPFITLESPSSACSCSGERFFGTSITKR